MASFQGNIKKYFSSINANFYTYFIAFIISGILFLLYSYVLNEYGMKKLSEMYDLKNEQEKLELTIGELKDQLDQTYLNSLLYFNDDKEIHRYQSLNSISDANEAFNELFRFVRDYNSELIPMAIEIKNNVFALENEILGKLSVEREIPDVAIQPLIMDNDTLENEVQQFIPDDESEKISLEAEAKLIAVIGNQLFELETLLNGQIDKIADQKIKKGILQIGVMVIFSILMLITFYLLYYFNQRRLDKRVTVSSEQLDKIAIGHLPEKLEVRNDDFKELIQNENAIIDYLFDSSEFAKKIGEGDFAYEFKPKSEEDALGNALMQMRNRLHEVATEDKVRNWMNEGHAKFNNILRESGNDMEELGDNIISNMVNYLNAAMGALYVINEENERVNLELLSAYAFNRKKFQERKLNPGEGLAGQSFKERKSIFITDVKTDHYNIVTGLGESKPSSILIVPLKVEDDIEGVIEIASFEEILDYQKEFVESIGRSIASAIKSGKSNEVTKKLLSDMQMREEEMKAQEEELKQNMEELAATQEQMDRLRKEDEARRKDLEAKRATLYDILDKSEYAIYLKDDRGHFVYVNQLFAESANKSINDIIGKTNDDILNPTVAKSRAEAEKKALSENTPVEIEEKDGGKVQAVKLMPFTIHHLEKTGVLGMVK